MPELGDIDLPEEVLKRLPRTAQETYRQAFSNAWYSYRETAREDKMSLKDRAHLVAMASLEAAFHKTARGRWVAD